MSTDVVPPEAVNVLVPSVMTAPTGTPEITTPSDSEPSVSVSDVETVRPIGMSSVPLASVTERSGASATAVTSIVKVA